MCCIPLQEQPRPDHIHRGAVTVKYASAPNYWIPPLLKVLGDFEYGLITQHPEIFQVLDPLKTTSLLMHVINPCRGWSRQRYRARGDDRPMAVRHGDGTRREAESKQLCFRQFSLLGPILRGFIESGQVYPGEFDREAINDAPDMEGFEGLATLRGHARRRTFQSLLALGPDPFPIGILGVDRGNQYDFSGWR